MLMPRPFLKAGQLLLVVALFATCGGHWVVLQSVAWTKMVATFSHDDGFAHALVKTFDGQHPCVLCKSIAQGNASEKQKDGAQVIVGKLILFHQFSAIALVRADQISEHAAGVFSGAVRGDAPPVPPPRAALA
jgi:hypothetical protein